MSRWIDANALMERMYHDAFENDASYNERNPMAKWDSGLWIRYKMFENAVDDAPTIDAVELGIDYRLDFYDVNYKSRRDEDGIEHMKTFCIERKEK